MVPKTYIFDRPDSISPLPPMEICEFFFLVGDDLGPSRLSLNSGASRRRVCQECGNRLFYTSLPPSTDRGPET